MQQLDKVKSARIEVIRRDDPRFKQKHIPLKPSNTKKALEAMQKQVNADNNMNVEVVKR